MNLLLVLLSFLLITSSVEAKDTFGRFAVNGKIGYFLPKIGSDVDKYYGGGQVFSLGGEYNLSSAFSMILCIDYKELDYDEKGWEKRDWEVAKVEEDYLRIILPTFSIIYKVPIGTQDNFLPYICGEIGVYLAKLKFKVSEIPNQYDWWTVNVQPRGKFPMPKEMSKSKLSYSNSARTTGFHLLTGFKYHLFSQLFISGELKYAYAPIPEWDNIDVGGITIVSGINYSF